MARITVEDCQRRVDNRFLLVQMAIKRVHQYREGYEPLVESKNKEVVHGSAGNRRRQDSAGGSPFLHPPGRRRIPPSG